MSLKFGRKATAAVLIVAGVCRTWGQVVTSFNPPLGSSGEQVNISGSGFTGSLLKVTFGGANASATATMDNLIIAFVPAAAVSGPICVSVNGGGFACSAADFTVIGPGPYITNFAPTVGSLNGGTPVSIKGVHFGPTTGRANNAYFNGVPAASFHVSTENLISVTSPAGATTGPIYVTSTIYPTAGTTNNPFTASNPNFSIPPSITGFSPASGRTGTNVIINGANFMGASAVTFNSVAASPITVLSNSAVQVSVPANATTGKIRITTPAGSATSSNSFTVLPTINGFAPNFGSVGKSVTVTGANFNVGTPTVRFNGVASSSVTGVSFGQLTATVPSGAATGFISITTTDGSDTNSALFYLPAHITSFTPTNSATGTIVTITGQNFLGTSAVNFNGASASFTTPTNNTTLLVTVPSSFTSGPISITTPAGSTNSGGLFYAPPMISGFNPTHGLPGTNVIISGTSFLGASVVQFAGTNASFTVLSNAAIKAIVPTNAVAGPITVVAPAGNDTSAGNFTLDYTSDIQVTVAALPNPVIMGSNLVFTITVANNGPFAAQNVAVTNTLPDSVDLIAATSTQGSLTTNSNPILASLGTLARSSTATVTLTVVPQTTGTITNVAAAGSDFPDPSPANNSFTNTVFVQPLPTLSIQRVSANRVNVLWPVVLSNFVLEYRTNLTAGSSWASNTTLRSVFTNQNVVNEPATNRAKYYRLRN